LYIRGGRAEDTGENDRIEAEVESSVRLDDFDDEYKKFNSLEMDREQILFQVKTDGDTTD
jgi:hypothetical protein